MAKIPKSIKELSKVVKMGEGAVTNAEDLIRFFNTVSAGRLDDIRKRIEDIFKTEKERSEIYKMMGKALQDNLDTETKIGKLIQKSLNDEKEVEKVKERQLQIDKIIADEEKKKVEQAEKYGQVLQNVADTVLSKILEQNKEIFQTAKDMQLESNLTWKQYSQAYNEAFEASRRINREVGQSISNARELIETQNFLMQGGFRGIDISDLTNLSSSVFALTRTLGGLPNELLITFQQSYRQFGSQTDQFVTNLGNRLNAFSNTFGVSIGMLSQTVAQMTQENAFLYRNNMQAQTRANENLMRAAALSGAMGLNSAAFISQLAGTSQFGSMSDVAQLYQGGALLEDFDTSSFTDLMRTGDAASATEMLFSSIGQTLGGMDDQFLRAEYMERIGGSFGLSRDDLLMITANAGNLGEISADLADKVANIDTSMVDELSELKMSVVDRLDNWWTTTGTSQQLSKVLQDLGLVGVGGTLKFISGQLLLITGKQYGVGGLVGGALGNLGGFNNINLNSLDSGTLGGGSTGRPAFLNAMSASGGTSMLRTAGMVGGGLALGATGNIVGRDIQSNTDMSNAGANILGGALNIGTGAAAGAMIGSVVPLIGTGIGAAIGAGLGAINTVVGASERRSAMQEMEDQRRAAARERTTQGPALTGDPIVDAINSMNANLTNVLNDNFQESIQMSFVLDTANRTDAGR